MADPTAPYEVLARRYRSRGFEELVGQEAIAETLRNAIESGRTAHAYLFCGTRGVGKTSMARIFAKALNASGGLLGEEQAVAEAILQGRDSDVAEIDAASNRGIDNARDLIAGAGIAPMRGPYRIYIIDEVHMLTTQAFNALLKTMEEPPKHVKFILCTTEPHQVPATIQSRCQRFEFRAIPASRIAAHLAAVLEQEGIESEPEVLARIARMANGSMRDGLSLLDRLVSGAKGRLTARQLEDLFGLPEDAVIDDLLAAMASGSPGEALASAGQLVDRGLSPERLLDAVAERLREVLVVATCGPDSDLLETSADRREPLARLAAGFDAATIASLIALCDSVGRSVRSSSAPRALLDAAVARMAMSGRFAEAAGLLAGTVPAKKVPAPAAGPESVRPGSAAARRVELEVAVKPKPAAVIAREVPAADDSKPAGFDLASLRSAEGLAAFWASSAEAAESPRRRAMLESIRPLSFDGRTITFEPAAAAAAARWLETRPEPLVEWLQARLGARVAVAFRAGDAEPPPRPSSERVDPALLEHPVVREAVDLFDATVLRAGPVAAWSESGGVTGSHVAAHGGGDPEDSEHDA